MARGEQDDLGDLDGRSDLAELGQPGGAAHGEGRASREGRVAERVAHHKARYAKLAASAGGGIVLAVILVLRFGGRLWSRHEAEQRAKATASRVVAALNHAIETPRMDDASDEVFELGALTQTVVPLEEADVFGLHFGVDVKNLDEAETLRAAVTLRLVATDGRALAAARGLTNPIEPGAVQRLVFPVVKLLVPRAARPLRAHGHAARLTAAQYARAKMARLPGAGWPHFTQGPGSGVAANGITRMVACVSALISASHLAFPHHRSR
jgi:hypothetical protein